MSKASMNAPITLIPVVVEGLPVDQYAAALQDVYEQTPSYWRMYNWPGAPAGQAQRDLFEAAGVEGRTMLGIAQRVERLNPQAGASLVGLVDFRLHWPSPQTAYLGMIMVAEPLQHQGIGRKAWRLWQQWLRKSTEISTVRLGVEQFNPAAMQFFQHLGFALTGEAQRMRVGDKFVRLLYMEQGVGSKE
ncbi:MAG: GNAT family N-acetyltransferase [Caldilineaceae bacterium]